MGFEKSESGLLAELSEFVAELRHYPTTVGAESIQAIKTELEARPKLRVELGAKPETLRLIVTNLFEFFQDQADSIVNRADLSAHQSLELDERIKLMWSVWPVMNCLLALLQEFDPDGYPDNAAQMYGVLSQALESLHATEILKAQFSEVFPLFKS